MEEKVLHSTDIYDNERKEEFNKFIGWKVDYPYDNQHNLGGQDNV